MSPETANLRLYRIEDHAAPKGLAVMVRTFKVIGETPSYYYVLDVNSIYAEQWDRLSDDVKKKVRRKVSKFQYPNGRFLCFLDIKNALRSYHKRKSRQLGHAELATESARSGLSLYNQLKDDEAMLERLTQGEILYEPNDYIEGMNWEDY